MFRNSVKDWTWTLLCRAGAIPTVDWQRKADGGQMGGMGIYWGRRTSGTQARKCAEMQTCVLTLSLGRRTGELQGLQKEK